MREDPGPASDGSRDEWYSGMRARRPTGHQCTPRKRDGRRTVRVGVPRRSSARDEHPRRNLRADRDRETQVSMKHDYV